MSGVREQPGRNQTASRINVRRIGALSKRSISTIITALAKSLTTLMPIRKHIVKPRRSAICRRTKGLPTGLPQRIEGGGRLGAVRKTLEIEKLKFQVAKPHRMRFGPAGASDPSGIPPAAPAEPWPALPGCTKWNDPGRRPDGGRSVTDDTLLHGPGPGCGRTGGDTHWEAHHLPGTFALPFKYHAEHRHRIPKARYRVTNWSEYDASLRQRGSLTVWFTDEAIRVSTAETNCAR
jgi:hypothetical protein